MILAPAILLSTSSDEAAFPLAVFGWFVIAALVVILLVALALKK